MRPTNQTGSAPKSSFQLTRAHTPVSETRHSKAENERENGCNEESRSAPAQRQSYSQHYGGGRLPGAAPDLSIFDFGSQILPSSSTTLTARIANSSNVTASADVVFYRGSVNAGTAVQFNRQTVSLAGLANTPVTTPTIAVQEGDIYSVCVIPKARSQSPIETTTVVCGRLPPCLRDLAIATAGISMAPVGADVGEPVQVNATIQNKRPTAARALVRLFQGHPQSPAAKLLGQTATNIPGSGVAVASWTVVRPAGDTNLFVSIDDVYPRENLADDNVASRNIFLKAVVDTGRMFSGANRASTYPAVGDLLGTGQPVMVFAEHTGSASGIDSRVTALQVQTDGTAKELWSKSLVPAPSQVLSPSIADLDGDGSPEIIVEAVHDLSTPATPDSELYVFALDKNGNTKWSHKWRTAGHAPCHGYQNTLMPVLGDMNKDGVADVTVIENELVVLDGRNGGELVRNSNLPAGANWCTTNGYAAVADVDGDGSNEVIVGKFGIHVFNSNGALRWKTPNNNLYQFALVDADQDSKPEIVVPVHRQSLDMYDAQTGTLKKRTVPSPWTPYADTIAVTASAGVPGVPTFAIANNDNINGTAVVDNQFNAKWWFPTLSPSTENPSHVALADLLGQGRPQIISRSDRHSIGIQDIQDGSWLLYTSLFGYSAVEGSPIPVDVDGDGRGEVIVNYGLDKSMGRASYEAQIPPANFLIFGSDHWKKIPSTWNQYEFVANQVDAKLAFRHDYQPYKSHNTWFQQPLRMTCDVDYDDDIDQNDINLIFAGVNQKPAAGDWRDIDKDGAITVNDARACTLKCTKPNCAAINPAGRILSVSPRSAYPGNTVQVVVRGEALGFAAGKTTANFGEGISVGPVSVLDANTATITLTIAPNVTGERVVTMATGTVTTARPGGFVLSAGNRPPVVSAGADQRVILPGGVSLSGSASDDGLPGGKLTTTWQMVGGPGVVMFTNPNTLNTTATFSNAGYYVLRLSATDGQYVASADLGVTVIAGNQAPAVSAGQDLTVRQDVPAKLRGDVQDDGLPLGSHVTSTWTMASGPGSVVFNPPNAVSPTASFSVPGSYVLRLTAGDGQLTASDDATVVVLPPPAQIVGITPNSGAPGQSVIVTIKAKYTKFQSGVTQANFGPGITAGKVTVVDDTTASVQVQISSSAAQGQRAVTVQTGTELATMPQGFVVGALGAPFSIRVNPGSRLVASGGSITMSPQVVDAAGNVLSSVTGQFTLTAAPEPGKTMGNAPQVTGLSVAFPKLAKRLKNWDQVNDPQGKYAAVDPSDPNRGRETGGFYRLTVSMQGSAVQGTAEVVVLPSGTADITMRVPQLAKSLGSALAAVRDAAAARNLDSLLAARAQLNSVLTDPAYSAKLLAVNHAMAPPNGFPATAAQLSAIFPQGPDDDSFGLALDSIMAHLTVTRARIDAINAAAVSQADWAAIEAAGKAFSKLNQQLSALNPTALAVTRNGAKMNELFRHLLPQLLDSLARKSMEVIDRLPSQYRSFATAADPFDFELYWNMLNEGFPLLTDYGGTTEANCIELGISLANNILNIALANVLNAISPGGVAIDFVAAGSDFSFACPLYPNTYVEGTGFSPELANNEIAVIGCINSNALRTLLTMNTSPEDLAADIRLDFDIMSLASAAANYQDAAAIVQPDEMRPGIFNHGSQMVFRNGWPPVNQGRIPCVGVVIAINVETGGFHAVNTNIVPSCQ